MIAKEKCTGCTACMAVCGVQAIRMEEDAEGFLYPVVEKEKCVHCGRCEQVCPAGKDRSAEAVSAKAVFAVYAQDETLRRQSSSGGLFSLLAQRFWNQGGLVFGCAMTEDCYGAHHIGVETPAQMWKLRGSKYVQSALENTLQDCKTALDAGKWVLFSGTPCQIAGLHAFLGQKNYEKLLTVDMICHGVPSPMVWREYAKQLEVAADGKILRVCFRDKTEGWKKYSLECSFSNGTKYRKTVMEDMYLRGFVENLILRPACHSCPFKDAGYKSDITMGDFWGAEHWFPEWKDSAGISIAIPHSGRGNQILKELSGSELRTVPWEQALKSNPSYFHPVRPNLYRSRVLRQIKRKGCTEILARYCANTIPVKLRKKLAAYVTRIHRETNAPHSLKCPQKS